MLSSACSNICWLYLFLLFIGASRPYCIALSGVGTQCMLLPLGGRTPSLATTEWTDPFFFWLSEEGVSIPANQFRENVHSTQKGARRGWTQTFVLWCNSANHPTMCYTIEGTCLSFLMFETLTRRAESSIRRQIVWLFSVQEPINANRLFLELSSFVPDPDVLQQEDDDINKWSCFLNSYCLILGIIQPTLLQDLKWYSLL